MTQEAGDNASGPRPLGLLTIVLRIVISLNVIRFAFSLLPGFEHGEHGPGLADQLFNPSRTSGFRSDFVWLFFSTIFIFFAMFAYIPRFRTDKKARSNVYLCLAGVALFVTYVFMILFTGDLDFG